jgi:hypothetical protein
MDSTASGPPQGRGLIRQGVERLRLEIAHPKRRLDNDVNGPTRFYEALPVEREGGGGT